MRCIRDVHNVPSKLCSYKIAFFLLCILHYPSNTKNKFTCVYSFLFDSKHFIGNISKKTVTLSHYLSVLLTFEVDFCVFKLMLIL